MTSNLEKEQQSPTAIARGVFSREYKWHMPLMNQISDRGGQMSEYTPDENWNSMFLSLIKKLSLGAYSLVIPLLPVMPQGNSAPPPLKMHSTPNKNKPWHASGYRCRYIVYFTYNTCILFSLIDCKNYKSDYFILHKSWLSTTLRI